MVLWGFAVSANEILSAPDMVKGTGSIAPNSGEIVPTISNEPSWKTLESMSVSDRQNSLISLDLGKEASNEAIELSHKIESLWNSGQFQEALSLFPELEEIYNIKELAIGNSWRVPVPTREQIFWGDDVRIGNKDSIYATSFDLDRSSGNFFVALLYTEGNLYNWALNLSTDNGASWLETYTWFANYELRSISTQVLGDFCYVFFGRGDNQTQALLYRFRAGDGGQANFGDGNFYHAIFTNAYPDSIREVALVSNQDTDNNRLYCAAIIADGSIKSYWSDTAALDWHELPSTIDNAGRGLDLAYNEGYDSLYLWGTYIDNDDNLQIISFASPGSQWNAKYTYPIGSNGKYSDVGAYNDTITCAFEYTGSRNYIKYLVSYNGGGTWSDGAFDDTTVTSESPALTARGGEGVAVTYRFYTDPLQQRFTYRHYAGAWSTPFSISNSEPYYNKPSIEYLGNGNYGVVYLSWTTPQVQAAYFDFGATMGVEEDVPVAGDLEIMGNYPNPFNMSTLIRYNLPRESDVSITIFDVAGREVGTIPNTRQSAGYHEVLWDATGTSSGVYFYSIRAGNSEETRKMILLK